MWSLFSILYDRIILELLQSCCNIDKNNATIQYFIQRNVEYQIFPLIFSRKAIIIGSLAEKQL